jgi:anti-sigma factor RsiW
MSCKDVDELLSAYSDRELDLMKSMEVEEHLKECVSCSDKLKTLDVLRNLTNSSSLYYSAPSRLRERIRSSIHREEQTQSKPVRSNARWLSYAACIVAAFLAGLLAANYVPGRSPDNSLTQEIVSSHLRSLLPDRLTDVASTDQHTVKPWFNGKVEFSPVVRDFSSQGFPLIGGRVDYIQMKRIPVLVYAHRKHFINVYSWPSTDSDSGPQYTNEQGYHVAAWTRQHSNYYAVSDLNISEMQNLVKLLRDES